MEQSLRNVFVALLLLGCGVPEKPLMARTDHLAVRGLNTEANPFSAAPDGSLTTADNTVLERPGMIEPRPGFSLDSSNPGTSSMPLRLFPWTDSHGDSAILRQNAAADRVTWTGITPPNPVSVNSGTLEWPLHYETVVQARNSLYINTLGGILKLERVKSLTAPRAGITTLPIVELVTYTASGTALATASYASYRVILVRSDANGLKIRSASSGIFMTHNTTGGTVNVNVKTWFSNVDTFVGDVLELYRTRTSTVEPDDEHYLTASYALASADISAQTYTFVDITPTAELGAALYINESREGIEGSNFAPPQAKGMALHNGSLFLANTLGPKRITISYSAYNNHTDLPVGIGYRLLLGRRTNGSNQISLNASTSGLVLTKGQIVETLTPASWSGASDSPVRVTTINSAILITVSQTWGGATDGADTGIVAYDSIMFSDTSEPWPIGTAPGFMRSLLVGMSTLKVAANATFFAYSPGVYYRDNNGGALAPTQAPSTGPTTLIIEERYRGDGPDDSYFRASQGNLYTYSNVEKTGPLPEYTSVDVSALALADEFVNQLVWSKLDEPEHFAPPSFVRIGIEYKAILALAPTRDALWIFKQDGLWRLSGVSTDSGWRVDPYDPTLLLLKPDSLVVLDDVVYAWTSRGLVMVTDSGVTPMGSDGRTCPIASDLAERQRVLSDPDGWTHNTWMSCDPQRSNVFVGVALLHGAAGRTQYVYVFNTRTREWTRWLPVTDGLVHMVYDPAQKRLVAANDVTGALQIQRTVEDNAPELLHTDYQASITITNVNSGTGIVTITAGSYVPAIGDVVRQSSVDYRVTEGLSTTTFTVDAVGLIAAAAVAYKAFTSTIEWNPKGVPTSMRRFTAMLLGFDDATNLDSITATCRTAGASADITKLITTSGKAVSVRALLPRSCARASVLWPGARVTQALASWRINGVGIVSEETGERVGR